MKLNYKLTFHAVERLQERFPQFCNNIIEIKTWERNQGFAPIKYIFNQIFEDCQENKSYLNNTENMLKLYENYGFNSDYVFLELKKENILFLLTKNRNEDVYNLVTIMPNSFRPLVQNVKYKAKPGNNELSNYEEIELEQHQPSYIDNIIMKEKLIELVENNTARRLQIISKTQAKYNAITNNNSYEFIYSKNRINEKNIEILSIKPNPINIHKKRV